MVDIKRSVGVVVIGRNEGERLIRCLDSLTLQASLLVYVDSGSTDGSVGAARQRGADVVELDLSRPFSMPRARNDGFNRLLEKRPDVEFVQFVDGDCEVTENWMPDALQALQEHPEAAIVCGRRRERFPGHSIFNTLCDIEWNTPVGEAASCGGDAMMRAEVFKDAGGFNEALIAGEEPELCSRIRKAGWKILRIDAEMTLHDANILHFKEWWKRNVRGGYGARDVVERLKKTTPKNEIPFMHLTQSAVSWTRNWLFTTLLFTLFGACVFGAPGAVAGAAAGLALFVLQALRIAKGIRFRAECMRDALMYGIFTMIGKWAQAAGMRKHARDRKADKAATLIEYKSDAPAADKAWQQDKARYPARAFFREPSMRSIALYRFGRWGDAHSSRFVRMLANRMYWMIYHPMELKTGISMNKLTLVGPGLRIHHFGNIFIHSDVCIGAGCTLRQGVTIGNREEGGPVPVVGNHVEFGAYAQVLGGINIGDGARIGAMSVVLQDVPPGATAVGIPARIIPAENADKAEIQT